MNVLLENPIAIGAVGALLATVALVVFLAKRSLASLVTLAGVVLMTLLGLSVERLVVTDREAVENTLAAVLEAVEANNVQGVLARIDPAAKQIRADAGALMPQIKVEKARSLGKVEVHVGAAKQPPDAACTFRAFLQGVHTKSGMQVAYFNQQVDIHWVKRGDDWLMDGYTAYYDGKPIDAVQSAAGNRPVR